MQQKLKIFSLLTDVFNILNVMCKVCLLLEQNNFCILSCSGLANKFSLMEFTNFWFVCFICTFGEIDWY